MRAKKYERAMRVERSIIEDAEQTQTGMAKWEILLAIVGIN
jgi:hypothetical protein